MILRRSPALCNSSPPRKIFPARFFASTAGSLRGPDFYGMDKFDSWLEVNLAGLKADRLYRVIRKIESPQGIEIEVDGRKIINFSSNDYLGLANEPSLKEAAIRAVEEFGTGSGASRLISGSLASHHFLEE